MKSNKIIIIASLLILIAAGAWYFLSPESSPQEEDNGEDVVAIVNGEEVFRSELDSAEMQVAANQGIDITSAGEQEREQIQSQAINNLVSQKLLSQAAQESNIEVSEEEVDEQIESIKDQFETDQEFQEALSFEGLTEEELRSKVKLNVSMQNYIDEEIDFSSVSVEESEVSALYDELIAGQDQENVPSLEESYDQVEQILVQQKQEEILDNFIEELRSQSDIEILI